MGSLLARFEASSTAQKGPRCTVALVLGQLAPDDAADLEVALESPEVTAKAIARVLAEDGHNIGAQSVSRHRRRDCACGRPS